MSVLDRLFGRNAQGDEDKPEATGSSNVTLTAQLAAEVAKMEASQNQTASELEQEKQKSAALQAKLDGAMTALRAGALRMAVRAHGAEGAQYEMAKATIEASDDPGSIGKLMEACEKAVPASLANANGTSGTADPALVTDKDRAAKYEAVRAAGLRANQPQAAGGK